MIKDAERQEKEEILHLWKLCYPTQDEAYLRFYFDHIYDDGISIVKKQDDLIISSLHMNYHVMSFHGKLLKCSYLLGASTLPDYRRRGHFHALMESMLDEAEHNCLISFMKAFNPKAYARYGFEVVYERKAYTIGKAYLHGIKPLRVFDHATADELLYIYKQFTKRFDGYHVRDIKYYELLLEELCLGGKRLAVYRDEHREVKGYVITTLRKNEVIVQEAVYMDSAILKRLLKKALGAQEEITLVVSKHEHIEKVFPLAIPKKQPYLMARINNYQLFNKLYNGKARNVKEAFAIVRKPLWNHEYY